MVYESAEALIGGTPIVRLSRLEQSLNLSAAVFAKLEYLNPAGSAKDRAALYMINDAESKGLLKPGGVIIEPTSGNTGIGLCCIAAVRGYRAIIVMPDSMSMERRLLMKAYGAELVLTDGSLGMQGAIRKAAELAASIPGSFIPGQFTNPANAEAHYRTTGPEIWHDLNGNIGAFIAGVGTGGTITGVGRYLKEKDPSVRVIAVEPATSPYLSKGISGKHNLQGIGAGFIPDILDTGVYDEILPVRDEDAYEFGRLLGKREGFVCGITSGAALYAAAQLAKRPEFHRKNLVALLPDTGDRYLTTPLFSDHENTEDKDETHE